MTAAEACGYLCGRGVGVGGDHDGACRKGADPQRDVPVLANPNETAAILVIGKPVHLSGMRSLRPSLSSRRSTSAHAAA